MEAMQSWFLVQMIALDVCVFRVLFHELMEYGALIGHTCAIHFDIRVAP